jgi:predicted O-methyltransferase YrrM
MIDTLNLNPPAALAEIEAATRDIGFSMASDALTGSLLRTLAASKPGGQFLELGTGTGMGTAWILDGMDQGSRLLTVDNDEKVSRLARQSLGRDPQVEFHVGDGLAFLQSLSERGATFDFIFADTWPGKYVGLESALAVLKAGGLYVVDDMLSQPTWPEGHATRAVELIAVLEQRRDLRLTKINWSTGVIVAVKYEPH